MLVYVTPYQLARRFIGLSETKGAVDNPAVLAMLRLDDRSIQSDEVPWCSAFVNYVAWLLDAPRSKSLAARSWLRVGRPVALNEAREGADIVVLSRGAWRPPADVLEAPGHVGFFVEYMPTSGTVRILAGNQGDRVDVADYPISHVLGVRRLR